VQLAGIISIDTLKENLAVLHKRTSGQRSWMHFHTIHTALLAILSAPSRTLFPWKKRAELNEGGIWNIKASS
jgi:hypothetical protein